MIGAGSIGAAAGGKYITFNDIAGSDKGGFKDADGVVVFEVNSLGNVSWRGTAGKYNT